MGEEDMRRQRLNVFRMRLLGAKVVGVTTGSRTLKDAISEAMRDWVTNVADTYYLLGSALGAHPYPMMVRDFHKVIGEEARRQILEAEGRLPDSIFACVGGGSNAIGIFHAFLPDAAVQLVGVEAGGRGEKLGDHAARFRGGAPGVLQGVAQLPPAGRSRAGFADAFRFGGAGLRDDRAGARLAARPEPRRIRGRVGRRSARGGASCSRAPRASFRRSNRRTRWPKRSGARAAPRARSSS